MEELELRLRQRLAQYLDGRCRLGEVHAWLGTEAWNIDARVNATVAQLYHDVELLLAEYAHGDWTEDELKDRLAPFAVYLVVEKHDAILGLTATGGNVGRRPLVFTPAEPIGLRPLSALIPALAS